MKDRTIGIVALTLGTLSLAVELSGVHFNFTASAPRGLWTESPITPDSIKRGTLVSVCPNNSPLISFMAERGKLPLGECVNLGVAPLLKAVGAVSGDLIKIRAGMPVSVNEKPLPNTVAMETLPSWPEGDYQVRPGQIWVFSTYSERSFDSRYFGPVNVSDILGRAIPVFVDGSPDDMRKGVMND